VVAAGGIYLALAFAAGASARTWEEGAARGAGTLVATLAAYYLYRGLAVHQLDVGRMVMFGGLWLIAALITGALFGAAGPTWSRHNRLAPAALGLLAGTLVIDGTLALFQFHHLTPRLLIAAEIPLGLALPLLVRLRPTTTRLRPRLEAYATLAATTITTLVAGVLLEALLDWVHG